MKINYKWIDKLTDSERYFRTPGLKIQIIKDNIVNVYGDIYLDDQGLTELPWKGHYIIQHLYGDLILNYNNLTNFDDFPKYIDGDLGIEENPIKDFKNAPNVTGQIYK